ncbi:MAG: ComF family protein [Candidatus Blackburnbacteria bacterium]|nr:ComF family protein [Candidatus Blackburnbacteria bacterium]
MDGVTHERCKRGYAPDGLTAIWAYEGAPRKLIHKLKYKYISEIALSLASVAAGVLKSTKRSMPHSPNWSRDKFTLVPVPLHWVRRNLRGFNQVEEVGKTLAALMNWEIKPLLVRKKRTKSQVGLKGKERGKNVVGAFALNPSVRVNECTSVLLFDDVWTTGSTIREATRVLKKTGYKKVWCLTLAR